MTAAQRVRFLRVLVVSIAVAWLCKAPFWALALRQAAAYPLRDFFFPPLLQRIEVVYVAALAPLGLAAWSLVRGDANLLGRTLVTLAAGSLVMLLHQLTFNDATFVTSLWTALFGLWLHRASARPSESIAERAGIFVQLIIALLFLGGFVGKLTPGYWDGSVMYGLYFERSAHWTFSLARAHYRPDALAEVARWYSRGTMLAELSLVTLPLWPVRASLWFATLSLLVLIGLNNFKLLSVAAPLLGMCVGVLTLARLVAREPPMEPASVAVERPVV